MSTLTSDQNLGHDKDNVRKRFARALATYDQHAQVQRRMAVELVNCARPYINCCRQMFEIGCGTGVLTREVFDRFLPETYVANDLVPDVAAHLPMALGNGHKIDFLTGDAETLAFPTGCDVVWSGAAVQWITALPAFFAKTASALNADGVWAFSTFGPDNYCQVKELSGSALKYPDVEELTTILSHGFTVLEAVQWHDTLWFDTPLDVLRHIRYTGVGGTSQQLWCKRQLDVFCRGYERFRDDEKGYPLTYHPILMVCKAVK